MIPTVKKQLQNSCFHFQKTDLTQRPFKHLPSPLQPPLPHLPIFFTDRNKRVFADLMHLQQQMLQWDICTRASLGSHNPDLLWFYSTGLLALARTHEHVSRLYTFTVLHVQKGFFSTRRWLLGLSGSGIRQFSVLTSTQKKSATAKTLLILPSLTAFLLMYVWVLS